MKKEDLMAALEAINKSGIKVAGDLVLEKHVEHEVANVEPGGIGIQINNDSSAKAAKPAAKRDRQNGGEKPDKPRETMTFQHKACVLEGHLTLLFDKLTKAGWISGEEAHFKALFSGELDEACTLTWISGYGKGTLVELFKQLVGSKLVIVPKGFTLSAILEGHFTDADGKWLTGLDKGNAANDKAMPFIQECVNLLKMSPNGDYDDDEDFKSEYDPFDHQDLNLHKR